LVQWSTRSSGCEFACQEAGEGDDEHDAEDATLTTTLASTGFSNEDFRGLPNDPVAWGCRAFMGQHSAIVSSIISSVKVDRSESMPLHDQVAAELRRAIAEGEASPGERLPPARDLAAVLGVNTNTVLRALRALRDEGLLEFRRGRGVTVSGQPERAALHDKARELVDLARTYGYRRQDIVDIIEALP
jgi:GntR family transcriptional regulator